MKRIALIIGLLLVSCGTAPDESTVTERAALCSSPHSDFNGNWTSSVQEDSGATYLGIATTITTPSSCDAGQIAMSSPFVSGFIEWNPNGGNHTLSDGSFGSIYGYTWVNIPGQPCTHPGGNQSQWHCRMNVFDSLNHYVESATWVMVR